MRMLVTVKYCGGCNPGFERSALVRELRAAFPDVTVMPAHAGAAADLALVVCGCSARCADHADITARYGKIVVASSAEGRLVHETIGNLRK